MNRRLPRLAPEVLVGGVDAPPGRQLDAGPVKTGAGAAEYAIGEDAVSTGCTVPDVRVGCSTNR